MDVRGLGQTGLSVSVLGYGAGAVGGLMVRGSAADMERSVGRALDAGITYFDTAPAYGDGESERNLGRVLKTLRATIVFGTKVRIDPAHWGDIADAIGASIDASLQRLQRDSVDLLQLHDPVTIAGGNGSYSVQQMLQEAVPALQKLVAAGKTRFIGITAIGETTALRQVVDSRGFDTAQLPFNLLNPSPVGPLPAKLPGHDFGGLMLDCAAAGMGVIGIRILAAGALSGELARHPIAMPDVAPIGSAASYAADVANAQKLIPLVTAGFAGSLVEAAVRFALTPPAMSTVLVGTASLEQLESAIAAAEKGPLGAEALALLGRLQG